MAKAAIRFTGAKVLKGGALREEDLWIRGEKVVQPCHATRNSGPRSHHRTGSEESIRNRVTPINGNGGSGNKI